MSFFWWKFVKKTIIKLTQKVLPEGVKHFSKKTCWRIIKTINARNSLCCYISALVLTCFCLKKSPAMFFQPETIGASFLHSMVLLPKVLFNNSWKHQFVVLHCHSSWCSTKEYLHNFRSSCCLEKIKRTESSEFRWKKMIAYFSKLCNQSLVSPHFLPYLIDPCFCGVKLTDGEKKWSLGMCRRTFWSIFSYLSYEIFRKNKFFPGISIWTRCGKSNYVPMISEKPISVRKMSMMNERK